MNRGARSRLPPWIESLVLSYGREEGGSGGQLKAHVIGVGEMSQSQAQGSEGPTRLLFLSDEELQIPAILTASAWEHVQEQDDLEYFTSLVNTTVRIHDYQLQFHMAPELTKCSFFLLVGELATTAAGQVKNTPPASTSQPSIRLKICQTWRALLAHQKTQDSQMSQWGDLSELLGEWQHDCLHAVLGDVRERLIAASSRSKSQQPSTSTYNPLLTPPDTVTATRWSVDRVRFKGVKPFPIKCLRFPEQDAEQLHTQLPVGSRTTGGVCAASEDRKRDLPQVFKTLQTTQPSGDDDAEWAIAKPEVVERDANDNSPCPVEDSMLHEDGITVFIDSDRPLSNPWDIFPPPCDTSSSSDVSTEATPNHLPQNPTATEFQSDDGVILTSMQQPLHSLKDASELNKEEHSFLPPYQKDPHSTSLHATATPSTSTSVSPPLSHLISATDKQHTHTDTAQQNLPALDKESQILFKNIKGTNEIVYRNAERKRREPTAEALTTLVEQKTRISGSPPSWLFDAQTGSGAEEGGSHQPAQTVGTVSRKTKSPTVHSDGRLFSYSYQVSGQNQQDFRGFSVAEAHLHWAVKYLVVSKQTDPPPNTSVSSQSNVI
ncbi:adrenocortical dysplasia protein homolog [Trematomus bernacchii]|uniref:adrenocortical dysplasia protein homolog n=1 Tax=Trematomus bernacchii TaxID=40690 RepID=UPI00146C8F2B|nr:adrenocortical dysplasia protein homolog [Trematomus bernacchii]